ncbi:MAG: alpha/beta fold hydrolase [Gemmataceae bacterium]|nr:alpha/beta fold hydrolase [Gemmataceae bacterium]
MGQWQGIWRKTPAPFRAVAWLIAGWLAISLAAVFIATHRFLPPWPETAPKVEWGAFEPVRLKTRDGLELGGWFLPSQQDRPSIIILHGYAQRRTSMLPMIRMYAERGCAVLALSARAHGDSSGFHNDIGYSARHDLFAAVNFLEEKRPGRPLVVHGVSMGAATAIYGSQELGSRVSGYVLEAPYLDAWTAVDNFTQVWIPQPFACLAFQGFRLFGPWFLPEISAMSPLEQLGGIPVSAPVLFLAGEKDRRARPGEIARLLEKVAEHGTLSVFKGAGHEPYLLRHREQYLGTVEAFLAEVEQRR